MVARIVILGTLLVFSECRKFDSRPPQRIVAQTLLAAEILYVAGLSRLTVALPSVVDERRYSVIPDIWPDVPRLNKNTESVLSRFPDLILMASYSNPEIRTQFEGAGIPVLVMSGFGGPDDYLQNLKAMEAAGIPDMTQVAERFRSEWSAAAQPALDLRLMDYSDGNTQGAGSAFHAAVIQAGFRNAAAELGSWSRLNDEQLAALQPDVVVIPALATECDAQLAGFRRKSVAKLLPAVRNGFVYCIDSALHSTTGPYLPRLAREIAKFRPQATVH